MALLVGNVDWPGEEGDPVAAVASHLGVAPGRLHAVRLVRKSLDARHGRQQWRAVYRVEAEDEQGLLARRLNAVRPWTARDEGRYGVVDVGAPRHRAWPTGKRPIVVGAGPAGLFCALYLAEAGAPVLLLERGGPVEERVASVNAWWRRRAPLDPENNLVFGEGGAGTFSDGKIYTRRRDGELGWIFRRLVDLGADPGILEEAWAHLGTDRVRAILPAFRRRLEELGTEVRYHARVDDLVVEGGSCRGVVLAGGQVELGAPVIVAAGHSARDTSALLRRAGAAAVSRAIAVGARIEHPQEVIDRARYGPRDRAGLPPADYRLSYAPPRGRSAHTFCMCPGGVVVPASNHPGRVVVNGMSFSSRRAHWANSAVIAEVLPEDYGDPDPLAGYLWQDRIERACHAAAGSDDAAPAQRVADLLDGRASLELPRTSYPLGVRAVDLRDVLPEHVIGTLIAAIRSFDRKVPGFAGEEAVLIAPETRTTSPVRFLRDARTSSTTVADLHPVGEGAGYGGGIVSCALDGMRAARAVVERVA